MEPVSRTDRGGGTRPPSCCSSGVSRARRRSCRAAARPARRSAACARTSPRSAPCCGERRADGRGGAQLRRHRHRRGRGRGVHHLLRVQLPAGNRGEPLLVRRRGARAVPRHRPRGRHVQRPPGRPRRHVPAGLRPDIQHQATGKLARQSLAVLEAPVRSAAWQQVPNTYLVCAEDRGTPAERQREFAARPARSSSSTPVTTRSCRSRPPSAT